MSEYVTKKDVEDIVQKAVTDLSEIIGNLAKSMHDEIVEIKREIVDLKKSHDRLLNTIDAFVSRIDAY